MRLTYFATVAIASILGGVQAIQIEEYTAAQTQLARDKAATGVPITAAQIKSEEEVADGLKVRLNTPECKDEKKVPFESAVMGALGELGSKSNDL